MRLLKAIRRSNFMIKLRSWEYWPFGIVQLPAILYWLWLSARARSLVFFSAANPGIPMGGMFGESKYDILQKIPTEYVPRTIKVELPVTHRKLIEIIETSGLKLPLIFKPDIGERGFMVRRIDHRDQISQYVEMSRSAFLIQAFVNEPAEFGVFYLRFPSDKHGQVISVVAKEMLSVIGDGRSTLQKLILENDRAKLQWSKLRVTYVDQLEKIIEYGKRIELVSIGNHAQGTRFIDANDLINDHLSKRFDDIAREIPGFYFGRFDVRCNSLQDLYAGNVKIMELNGCGAEPAHIYDTEFSLWKAFSVLVKHWDYIFRIARANKEQGVDYISLREAMAFYRKFKAAVK